MVHGNCVDYMRRCDVFLTLFDHLPPPVVHEVQAVGVDPKPQKLPRKRHFAVFSLLLLPSGQNAFFLSQKYSQNKTTKQYTSLRQGAPYLEWGTKVSIGFHHSTTWNNNSRQNPQHVITDLTSSSSRHPGN